MSGKDILKFHAITWPAMLLALGLDLPRAIYVHGFITIDNQKISKTIGNVIDPIELIEKYGLDPVRYFLMREIASSEDGDFSYKKLEDRYNGDLANNLGNLVSRTAKLIETKLEGGIIFDDKFFDSAVRDQIHTTRYALQLHINEFKLHEALADVWQLLAFANGYIDEHKPWAEAHGDVSAGALAKEDHLLTTLTSTTALIITAAQLLEPFMPETSAKILEVFGANRTTQLTNGLKLSITSATPLFPRIDK